MVLLQIAGAAGLFRATHYKTFITHYYSHVWDCTAQIRPLDEVSTFGCAPRIRPSRVDCPELSRSRSLGRRSRFPRFRLSRRPTARERVKESKWARMRTNSFCADKVPQTWWADGPARARSREKAALPAPDWAEPAEGNGRGPAGQCRVGVPAVATPIARLWRAGRACSVTMAELSQAEEP